MTGPLLTLQVHEALRAALRAGLSSVACSLDLEKSTTTVQPESEGWRWEGQRFPYLEACKDRTIYYWDGEGFRVAARYAGALYKLVPT